MDPPPLASHVSKWFCPALSVPPLLTILTVSGRIVVATVVGGCSLVVGFASVVAVVIAMVVVVVVGLVEGTVVPVVVVSATDSIEQGQSNETPQDTYINYVP